MLTVVATGTRDGKLGKRREDLIYDISKVCVEELGLDRFKALIHIKQTRTKQLMDGFALGYAQMDKIDTDEWGKVWWGIIEITNQHPKGIAKTLCHEWVHIKQYLRKELSFDGKTWMGNKVETEDYYKQPCEIEAYNLQESLYYKCVDLKII